MTMLIAGHETTAAVLTWTLHCLADRPDVLKRLQQEVGTLVFLHFCHTCLSPLLSWVLGVIWPDIREVRSSSNIDSSHSHLPVSIARFLGKCGVEDGGA